METPIKELKGTNGTIKVYDDRVVICRKGFVSWATQGFKGDRVYFYSQLSGIDFKRPNMLLNGYMKFITGGIVDRASKVKIYGSTLESARDENTVILRAFNPKIPNASEELYQFVMTKVEKSKHPGNVNGNNQSPTDEIIKFKQLLDDGILSKDEFESKKKQILGI